MSTSRRIRIGMAVLLASAGKNPRVARRRRRIAADLQVKRVWELAAGNVAPAEIARRTGLARDAVALLLSPDHRPRTEDSAASGTIFRVKALDTEVIVPALVLS